MDLQRLQALGMLDPIIVTGSAIGADKNAFNAPKYKDSNAGSVLVDNESEWIIVGYQFSADTAGSFFLENAAGGGAAIISPTHFYPVNTVSPLIECFIPVGKGKAILIGGSPGGNFSIVIYIIDRNYKNTQRVKPGT
jgi:hypothetical protein